MAAVTICSDFEAPKNKVWHCFHCFPIYLQWSDGTRCHDLSFLNVELLCISILLFSHSVISDSLWPHGLQHARPPYPSLSPKVCPSSCPLHWWYHPAISSSDAVFSFCPQSLLASGTFPMSHNRWPKFWSFNFSISPSNEYSVLISLKIDWFDLLAVQGALRSLLQHHNSKPSTLWRTAFLMVQLSQPYVTTGKTIYLQMVFNHRDFQYSTGLHSE